MGLNDKYKVTVVMPLYNKADHLENRLRFINKNSSELARHIIVDHSSTDGSSEIASRFCREHENFDYVLIHNTTHNPSEPRNVGLQMTETDYIMFVDADDLVFTKNVDETVNYMDANPHCSAACGVFSEAFDLQYYDSDFGAFIRYTEMERDFRFGNIYDSLFGLAYMRTGDLLRKSKIKHPYRNTNIEDFVFGIEFLYNLEQADYVIQTKDIVYIYNLFYIERIKSDSDDMVSKNVTWLQQAYNTIYENYPEFSIKADVFGKVKVVPTELSKS